MVCQLTLTNSKIEGGILNDYKTKHWNNNIIQNHLGETAQFIISYSTSTNNNA